MKLKMLEKSEKVDFPGLWPKKWMRYTTCRDVMRFGSLEYDQLKLFQTRTDAMCPMKKFDTLEVTPRMPTAISKIVKS